MSAAAPRAILDEHGRLVPGAEIPSGLGREEIGGLHRLMLRQRQLDELMLTLQRQGRITFYGAATGQEAAVFGSGFALEADDWILPALREGGVALMRGYPLRDYVAQCFGNAADLCRGRQMPCHYGSRDQRYVTLSSPIGNQLPQAAGVARAMKLRRSEQVCLAYLGDGAASQNDFHTAAMLAAREGLPLILFCQNNQWAISTPFSAQSASATIADRARYYGMKAERVDGNDALVCFEATREAAARARAGEGPTLIEALTYRMGAHSTSDDPSRYRDEAVTEAWKARDPIVRLRRFRIAQGWADEAGADALAETLAAEIREVLAEVEGSQPAPPLASMFDDVFAERPRFLDEELAEAARFGGAR